MVIIIYLSTNLFYLMFRNYSFVIIRKLKSFNTQQIFHKMCFITNIKHIIPLHSHQQFSEICKMFSSETNFFLKDQIIIFLGKVLKYIYKTAFVFLEK